MLVLDTPTGMFHVKNIFNDMLQNNFTNWKQDHTLRTAEAVRG